MHSTVMKRLVMSAVLSLLSAPIFRPVRMTRSRPVETRAVVKRVKSRPAKGGERRPGVARCFTQTKGLCP